MFYCFPPLDTVKCKEDRTLPYAVRTALGWSIIGGHDPSAISHMTHKITSQDITTDKVLKRLEEVSQSLTTSRQCRRMISSS